MLFRSYITSGNSSNLKIKTYLRVGYDGTDNIKLYGGTTTIGTGTNASSTTTGALVVAGGAGIGGDTFIGKILSLTVSTAAPATPAVGMFAVADRVNWDPASKGSGNAYPVFYDGSAWHALY